MSNSSANKRIAINTIVIYVKMIVSTIVGLFSTRYVLLALGVADYGLYNVVAGVLILLNFISTAMHTTTRRYVNVEKGKKEGNVNEIFNICLLLHIGFALLTLILAESIGNFYINQYLNIPYGKLDDAMFVFQISTIVAILGLINVPYQALLNAYEQFLTISVLDILQVLLKLPLVFFLIKYEGNALRFFAIGMCIINLCTFIAYHLICYSKYKSDVKHKIYKDRKLYKELLVFTGYTATGAGISVVKTQGASMIANYFLGVLVNGALALTNQIERYVMMLVSNLATSSAPQITQSYSSGDYQRSQYLVEKLTRFMILAMTVCVTVLACDLEFVLTVWLKKIPEGAFILCEWILISLYFRSFGSCVSSVMIANGRLKETTILSVIVGIGYPLILFLLLKNGFPAETVIILYTIMEMILKVGNLIIINYIAQFNVIHYLKSVYPPIIVVGLLCVAYYYLRNSIPIISFEGHLTSMIFTTVFTILVCAFVGLKKTERSFLWRKIDGSISKWCRIIR